MDDEATVRGRGRIWMRQKRRSSRGGGRGGRGRRQRVAAREWSKMATKTTFLPTRSLRQRQSCTIRSQRYRLCSRGKRPWQLRSDTPISHSPSSTGVVSLSLSTGSGTGTGTEKEGGEIVPGSKMLRGGGASIIRRRVELGRRGGGFLLQLFVKWDDPNRSSGRMGGQHAEKWGLEWKC